MKDMVAQMLTARDRLTAELERTQAKYDSLPEGLQMSFVGDAMETKMERIADGIAELDEQILKLQKASIPPQV